MSLFFDTKVEFLDTDAFGTIGSWHATEAIFAVASFSQERGGSVTVFADNGEPQRDVTYPIHPTSQCTALAWHPEKVFLVTGWENGNIYVWFAGHREFANVSAPHKAAITLVEFSELGGRMVTADIMGLLIGWRCDGQYQFLTMFSHDLRNVLLHITFRRTIYTEARDEMLNLAKAAVAGDENALDTLTNWRPRTAVRSITHAAVKDNYCFYACTQIGHLYYMNQSGTCSEVLNDNSTVITQMLWHPKKDAVICLMEDKSVIMYLVETTGILTELERVKFSSRTAEVTRNGAIVWVDSCLAIITGDLTVRIWDIDKSDHYVLQMHLPNATKTITSMQRNNTSSSLNILNAENMENRDAWKANTTSINTSYKNLNEYFTCIIYINNNHTLCAGTNLGNLYTWKRSLGNNATLAEDMWQLTNISYLRSTIKQCLWGFNELGKPYILITCASNVYVLKEQALLAFHTPKIWAIQQSARSVFLEHIDKRKCTVQIEFCVTALVLNGSGNNLVVSDGRNISTYSIQKLDILNDDTNEVNNVTRQGKNRMELNVKLMQTFVSDCLSLYAHNENIFCLTATDVTIFSIGGVVLHKIQSNANEGKIIGSDLSACYLTVFTMNGYIKTYDVSRHEPKAICPVKCAYDIFDDFGEIIQVKCNAGGTHLALIIADSNFLPKSILYCWDMERNIVMELALAENIKDINSVPVSIWWDFEEYPLLSVEVKSLKVESEGTVINNSNTNEQNKSSSLSVIETNVHIIFYTERGNLKILESSLLKPDERLLGLCIPNLITLAVNVICAKPLRDFMDLKECDLDARRMVLNFSMHLAEGNMDMAYKSIRSIKSEIVWTNLAKMCVRTNRLDVAKVCMGHLGEARSVRAIRQAMEDDDLDQDAKTAILAIELGMKDEAKALYLKCQRYDLLTKYLRSSGHIDEAISIAETKDRIHLKNVYYHKAQECRENGDILKALEYFEKTQNSVQNITQMLLENPSTMKRYMQSTKDHAMLKWWGQYIESSGDMEEALSIYQKAEDWYSQVLNDFSFLVKILCYLGKIAKADAVARQSGNAAACYHLARHYENIGKFQDAIMFYTRARTFGNAIRICKENDFQDELWNVANASRSREKAIAAAYFEECGSYKRAVELYHRAGLLHKALNLAFDSGQPDILEIIANELTADSDSELINRCADFFISIAQYQKAVHLLAKTKQLKRSVEICLEKGVPITEDLIEMLTPQKGELDETNRVYILTQLAELLQQQGDYHAATKKFTQAGDKERAMKCLLKSGNTEKILYFANISRQREVYIMAANYLQSLNWQEDNNILKHIVTFYSKGQAYDSLANFYAICAQIEIDEYHNYEKALNAMHEAAQCLQKLNTTHTQQALVNLQRTIADVKIILNLQSSFKTADYHTVINGCRDLLIKRVDAPPIRQLDIWSLLILALAYSNQYNEAGKALKELSVKNPNWSASGVLDKTLIQKICQECNLDFETIWYPIRRNVPERVFNQNDNDNANDVSDEEEIQEMLR